MVMILMFNDQVKDVVLAKVKQRQEREVDPKERNGRMRLEKKRRGEGIERDMMGPL